MARFELSRLALTDLHAIADYTLERWGREQTLAYIEALQDRLTELAHQPLLGRRRDELAQDVLCFPFESHVVFYLGTDFGISVVRILHKRQDPSRHID